MNIFLTRHGETDWNKERKVQGSSDISKLTEAGMRGAKILKDKLKDRFDIVYSSPLKRAMQTTDILNDGKPVKTDKRLVERCYGELEGRYWSDIERNMPEMRKVYLKTKKLPGVKEAETLEALQARCWGVFTEIVNNNKDRDVLIISHGDVNRIILATILEMPLTNIVRLKQSNCCVNEIKYKEDIGSFRIISINEKYDKS